MDRLINTVPQTWAEAYSLYEQDYQSTNLVAKNHQLTLLRTAVFRYVLPKYNVPLPKGNKLTSIESKTAWKLMEKIPTHELKNALSYQDEVFTFLKCTLSIRRTYRMHLTKFILWNQQQSWWKWGVLAIEKEREKRCPKMRNTRSFSKDKPRVTERQITRGCPNFHYTLKPAEILPDLQQELDLFLKFQTAPVGNRNRQDRALRPVSGMGNVQAAKRVLGWLHRDQGIPLEELSLKKLVAYSGLTPEGKKDEAGIDAVIDLIEAHLQWLRDFRGASPNTELKAVECLVAVAKYLYHKASKQRSRHLVGGKQVGYKDIPIIEELRQLERDIMIRVNQTPRRSDESKKWLDWPVFLACVKRLVEECGERSACGKNRPLKVIAKSHQIALIFMLLSAFPDRSRTLRELELGRTLFNRDGKWFIEHAASDFKTGDSFCKNGQKRVVELPESLYPFLTEWLEKWRPIFNPKHGYFFTRVNGTPLNTSALNSYFRNRSYRLTGQLFTPHMVRDSIVTHLKLSGAGDGILAALADLMAHSQRTQAQIYDRRTPSQKVAPALEALQSLSAGILPEPIVEPLVVVSFENDDAET
ncbi:site-specific integrase [Microcoleus sp. B3-D7]|uniref:site-specific integrase n=1 Tax=Microcoleus sp. B3-D7 TaxID=2818659 RepID=UPI002FD4610F